MLQICTYYQRNDIVRTNKFRHNSEQWCRLIPCFPSTRNNPLHGQRLLGTGKVVFVFGVLLSLPLGARHVDVAFNSTDAGRFRILHRGDAEVASQTDCKHLLWLDISVSAAEVNPFAVPTGGDNIAQVDVFVTLGARPRLLAEDGGLGAAELWVRMRPVRTLQVDRNPGSNFISFGIGDQPASAVLIGTVDTSVRKLGECGFTFVAHGLIVRSCSSFPLNRQRQQTNLN